MYHKRILNTWKEIAQYVGRSERTIQRWEKELGFPIHRPRGKQHSAVLAIPEEIDRWATLTPSTSRVPRRSLSPAAQQSKRVAAWLRAQQRRLSVIEPKHAPKLDSQSVMPKPVPIRRVR